MSATSTLSALKPFAIVDSETGQPVDGASSKTSADSVRDWYEYRYGTAFHVVRV